ncbi:MAG: hypothetical protein CM15mP74_27910 [Halieaceae bacterium]|nr:MAG: hypothetical protein CM15mP74_27910 [Halieaceae bacterium]
MEKLLLSGSLLLTPLGFVKINDAATQNGGFRMLSHFDRPVVSKTDSQR